MLSENDTLTVINAFGAVYSAIAGYCPECSG
jgi:hypothetical protein